METRQVLTGGTGITKAIAAPMKGGRAFQPPQTLRDHRPFEWVDGLPWLRQGLIILEVIGIIKAVTLRNTEIPGKAVKVGEQMTGGTGKIAVA